MSSVSYSSVVAGATNNSQKGGGGSRGRSKVIRNSNNQQHYQNNSNVNHAKQYQNGDRQGQEGNKSGQRPYRQQQQHKNQYPNQQGQAGLVSGGSGIAPNQQGLMQQNNNGIGILNKPPSSNGAGAANLGALFDGLVIKSNTLKRVVISGNEVGPGNVPPQPQPPSPISDEVTIRLNKEALKRNDEGFAQLLTTANQVVVFDYDFEAGGGWKDTKTAGCFFIYRRSIPPDYGLVVLNRKGLKNLVVFFDQNSQVIPQKPYLLFRQGATEACQSIKSIWFYKESDFDATIELLHSLGVHFDQQQQYSAGNQIPIQQNIPNTGNQLFSMLQGPPPPMAEIPIPAQKPRMITAEELEQEIDEMDPAICMVKKFSSGPSQKSMMIGGNDSQVNSNEITGSVVNDASRSMMQMRTVEQLEKKFVPIGNKISVQSAKNENSATDIRNDLLATLGVKPTLKSNSAAINSTSPPKKSQYMTPIRSQRENRKLTIDDLDGKLYNDTNEDMRATSALIGLPQENTTNMSHPSHTLGRINPPQISPLTKDQLLQAMSYLLQTDAEFVTKIHEAYVKSSVQPTWSGKPF